MSVQVPTGKHCASRHRILHKHIHLNLHIICMSQTHTHKVPNLCRDLKHFPITYDHNMGKLDQLLINITINDYMGPDKITL